MEPLLALAVLILFMVIRLVVPVTVMFSVAKLLDHFIAAS